MPTIPSPPTSRDRSGRGSQTTPLTLTGERTAPDIAEENYWFRRHEAVYEWIASFLIPPLATVQPSRSTRIVDTGCGEGYGSAMLSSNAGSPVIGLELDGQAASYAHARYGLAVDELTIVQANLDGLPISSNSVNLVVSLQVVEHLWALPRFLRECGRVLTPGGQCAISTPNRLTFSPGLERSQKPTNPFHVEEFDAQQLVDLLGEAGFSEVTCFGLHHGERITEWELANGSITAALVGQALSGKEFQNWPTPLRQLVTSVDTSDFVLGASSLDTCIDLVAVGRFDAGAPRAPSAETGPAPVGGDHE